MEQLPSAKTPVLQDKRFLLAVATVASLLLASVFKIEVAPEMLATIAAVVIGAITNSAVKEAAVAKANAAAIGADAASKRAVDAPVSVLDLVNK